MALSKSSLLIRSYENICRILRDIYNGIKNTLLTCANNEPSSWKLNVGKVFMPFYAFFFLDFLKFCSHRYS